MFLLFCLMLTTPNQTAASIEPTEFISPASNEYYFRGKSNQTRHTLTFDSDSSYHITVPNKSGSCWTWGEYGGTFLVRNDTVSFKSTYYEISVNGTVPNVTEETFVWKENKFLVRISPEKFMLEKYELKSWKR